MPRSKKPGIFDMPGSWIDQNRTDRNVHPTIGDYFFALPVALAFASSSAA